MKNIFIHEKLIRRLTFNPGLPLTGFRTTRPRVITFLFHFLVSLSIIFRIKEDHPIMSFSVSEDGRHALINVAQQVRRIILLHLSGQEGESCCISQWGGGILQQFSGEEGNYISWGRRRPSTCYILNGGGKSLVTFLKGEGALLSTTPCTY